MNLPPGATECLNFATDGLDDRAHGLPEGSTLWCAYASASKEARIVKATREGRWNKLKALQRLLTQPCCGNASAVKRVTKDHGKRTPSVDRVTRSTPTAKLKALGSLQPRGYRLLPLRRVYKPKANGNQWPLRIPVMRDRAMQALQWLALAPVAETTADPDSYGFQPERSTADALQKCFPALCQGCSPRWLLEGDIQGCYDHSPATPSATRIAPPNTAAVRTLRTPAHKCIRQII